MLFKATHRPPELWVKKGWMRDEKRGRTAGMTSGRCIFVPSQETASVSPGRGGAAFIKPSSALQARCFVLWPFRVLADKELTNPVAGGVIFRPFIPLRPHSPRLIFIIRVHSEILEFAVRVPWPGRPGLS